jgi:hypothetical protein
MEGKLHASEGRGCVASDPDRGSGGWSGFCESRATVYGPFCIRWIVGVWVCPVGSLVRVYGVEKCVRSTPKWAELKTGLK